MTTTYNLSDLTSKELCSALSSLITMSRRVPSSEYFLSAIAKKADRVPGLHLYGVVAQAIEYQISTGRLSAELEAVWHRRVLSLTARKACTWLVRMAKRSKSQSLKDLGCAFRECLNENLQAYYEKFPEHTRVMADKDAKALTDDLNRRIRRQEVSEEIERLIRAGSKRSW